MMFIIEKFIDDYNRRVEQWERARDKWKDEHEYYSNSDYEERYPRPLNWVKVIPKAMAIGAIIGLMGVLIIGFAKEIKVSNDNKPKEEVVQSDKNCRDFNKDDHVRIQYGDYTGNNGKIIGGCEEGQHYQVKLDENQKANVSNDGNEDPVDVGGNTISVDSSKNLVKIELPEEKKE